MSRHSDTRHPAINTQLGEHNGSVGRWLPLVVLAGANVVVFFWRYAAAVVAPEVGLSFALSPTEVGLFAAVFFWTHALMQPVAGVLADVLGPRRAGTSFLIVAGLGTLLVAVAPTFALTLVGRGIAGLGSALVFAGSVKLMLTTFSPRQFATLRGVLFSIGNLGVLLAAAPLAWSSTTFGWRASMGASGVVALIFAAALWLSAPDTGSGSSATARPQIREALAQVLSYRDFWLLAVYIFFLFGSVLSFQGLWALRFATEVYGFDGQSASGLLTIWAVGLALGAPLWGYVADRIVDNRKLVAVAGLGPYAAVWLTLAAAESLVPAKWLWLIFFAGGLFASTWGMAYPLLVDGLPTSIAGTATGLLNFAFFVGGACYQQLTGVLLAASSAESPLGGYQAIFALYLGGLVISLVAIALTRDRGRTTVK